MSKKAWIIGVNMGYGHQRTAYPLRDLAPKKKIINANDYRGIPESDCKHWENSRAFYEFISRFKRVPFVGEFLFSVYDRFQEIVNFYPKKDSFEPVIQLKVMYYMIRKGWGRHLIEKLKKKSLPFITTFFVPAFMAEQFNYPNDIYCVICDADIARPWASLVPRKSKIKYFAPNSRVVERLKLYGVPSKQIHLTGYPLPLENVGTAKKEILKKDVAYRLLNLDPKGRYTGFYEPLVKRYIGRLPKTPDHPLTIMFAVGGAGAQKEIGVKILKSLSQKIKRKETKVILVAGVRKEIKRYFERNIRDLGMSKSEYVDIVYDEKIDGYFKSFNKELRKTDILWTKPSELSFYTALGLPMIMAPIIGSQEKYNRRWLLKLGTGTDQRNPDYAHQWLYDWLELGWFAEAAMQGFIEGESLGALNIRKLISK